MKTILDVSLRRWLAMDHDSRAVFCDTLTELVPRGMRLVAGAAAPLPVFIDEPTELRFYLVFGQLFTMGAPAPRVGYFDPDSLYDGTTIEALVAFPSPPRDVDVAPFFLGELMLDASYSRPAMLAEHGWRLPCEAELDLMRVVSHHTRLTRLDHGLCADDFHRDYEGAPARGVPFGSGATLDRHVALINKRFRLWRGETHRFENVRPCRSLFDEATAFTPEAVAARAEGGPMTAPFFYDW